MSRYASILVTGALLCLSATVGTTGAQENEGWVARSDRNTQLLLDVLARFDPEAASGLGMSGLDEQVTQLPLDNVQRRIDATDAALAVLRQRLARESEAQVRQDLEILIAAGELGRARLELDRKLLLPYLDLPQAIYFGLRSLLDAQVAPERRAAALVRLRRYAGMEDGYQPLASQVEAYLRASLGRAELIGPYRREVERDLAMTPRYVEGIADLLRQYEVAGHEQAYDELRRQISEYEKFVREQVLTRAREDFRLPPELYALRLRALGVHLSVDELAARARVAFREIQLEMQALAPLVASARKLSSTDYRDVVRDLKREQLTGTEILQHYQQRIAQLERVIEDRGLFTLPAREMVVRLASEAESAAVPSPLLRMPRLIDNTGEMAEFVLPVKAAGGDPANAPDDYSFAAASWTLAVHEGRPGHELQVTSLVERGVSRARAIYAFNSANVEGWAVYCEAEMKPYLPLEGQLISLQQRMLRAARAFLDPGLQAGSISRDQALQLLEHEVALSPALARQELERYTFLDPGQATSYFCGYLALMELRAEAQRILGARFQPRAFHDLVLAQGLLPLPLLRQAVLHDLLEQGRHEAR